MDCWQKLMDQAYDRWTKGDLKSLSYSEFIDELDPLHRKAVLLGNLNYQVNNGGFSQWIGNDYAQQATRVLSVLKEINTPNCNKVAELVKQIIPRLNHSGKLDANEPDEEQSLDGLDKVFYALKDFPEDVEAFLRSIAKGKSDRRPRCDEKGGE